MALVVALVIIASCARPSSVEVARTPTGAEAAGLLDRAVDLARGRDFVGLCALGGGNCEAILEEAGRDAVPARPPTLVGQFDVPSVRHGDGSVDVGGRVLVICGVTGRGEPFRTEMLVFFDGTLLRAIEPIYWSGGGIARRPQTAPRPHKPAACATAEPSSSPLAGRDMLTVAGRPPR